MAINYDKLAEEFGGIDYDAIAGEFGGSVQERMRPQIAPEEPKKSLFRRFLGELPKEAVRQTVGLGAKTALSLAELPETFLKGRATQREYNVPLVGPTKSIQSEAETIGGEIIEGQKPLSAIARPLSEAVLGPIDLALGAKGLIKSGQAAASTISGRRIKKSVEEAIELAKPVLTSVQEEVATQAGRKVIPRFGQTKILPDQRDIERGIAVHDIIKKRKNEAQNIDAVRGAIAKTGKQVEEGLKTNNAIFNNNQLRTRLNQAKEESKLIFAGDAAQERAYNSVTDKLFEFIGKKKNNISSLLESRQELDLFMKRKFGPDILNPARAKDNVRSNALLDVRMAANDYIAELLPEGNKFKDLLRQENLMFETIRNLAKKSPKVGSTFLQRSKTLKGIGKTVGAGATAAGTYYGLKRVLE